MFNFKIQIKSINTKRILISSFKKTQVLINGFFTNLVLMIDIRNNKKIDFEYFNLIL